MSLVVAIPLPDHDFDVTEVAVPWAVLREAGHELVFATEQGGRRPAADPRLIDGVIFGRLGARPDALALYDELLEDPAFRSPVAWDEITSSQIDALLLPGGHAAGMRQYLGSSLLQQRVGEIWAAQRPVAAICHGTVLLARSLDPSTGRSVLEGHRSTGLTKHMERSAYLMTAWRLGRYYRTYPAYVQDEVAAALGSSGEFVVGPRSLRRDSRATAGTGFVVRDGCYLSSRWPGDAWTFASAAAAMLDEIDVQAPDAGHQPGSVPRHLRGSP